MLVAVKSITISATTSGTNAVVSFPTQTGSSYSVLYRNSLTTGNWALLATVPGDGTVKSVSDPMTGSQRFYKVTTP